MTDDELDQLLRQTLDVSPSPHVAARVRARVVDEPARHRRWAWAPGLTAVAAVVVAILSTWPDRRHPPGPAAPIPRSGAPRGETPSPGPVVDAGVSAARPHAAKLHAVIGRPPPGAQALFDPDDRVAFDLLVTLAESGGLPALAGEPLEVAAPLSVAGLELAPLDVPPLEVSALVTTEIGEGDPP